MRPWVKRISVMWGGLLVAGLATAFLIVHEVPIRPVPQPDPTSFPPSIVSRGATLAAIGDCTVCHTALGGPPFAGGRPLATPFGTIYVSNITPDPTTGIGSWSLDAFRRAMTRGIGRDGTHLYPALPYEHYTHVATDDLDALYAFLMTRRAVQRTAPTNQLIFPLGYRPLLAGWNLLFLDRQPFRPDPKRSEAWNRGAYLVEGLGHCGGCHTPRNFAGGEERSRAYAGGLAEGWISPALDGNNPAPIPWTVATLTTYLRTGYEHEHGAASGPMGPVVHGLSEVPESDVHAIATYIVTKTNHDPLRYVDSAQEAVGLAPQGAALFAGACAGCHEPGAPMLAQGRAPLQLVSNLHANDPRNTIHAILQGVQPPLGRAGPFMPPFGVSLTDEQVVTLTTYLRARFSPKAPWSGLEQAVRTARKEGSQP